MNLMMLVRDACCACLYMRLPARAREELPHLRNKLLRLRRCVGMHAHIYKGCIAACTCLWGSHSHTCKEYLRVLARNPKESMRIPYL